MKASSQRYKKQFTLPQLTSAAEKLCVVQCHVHSLMEFIRNKYQVFTCALLQHDNNSLAVSCWLNTNSLLVHQTIEAERIPCLQVVGLLSHKWQ